MRRGLLKVSKFTLCGKKSRQDLSATLLLHTLIPLPSSSSSLHSNGNYLLHTTLCPARPLLLDANMLDANNIPVGQRVE
jgi:hypothetical protein